MVIQSLTCIVHVGVAVGDLGPVANVLSSNEHGIVRDAKKLKVNVMETMARVVE